MAEYCATCGVEINEENGAILFLNSMAVPVYVCDECEKKIDRITSDESMTDEEMDELFSQLTDGVEQGVEIYLRGLVYGDSLSDVDMISEEEMIINEIYLADEDEKYDDYTIKNMANIYLNMADYEVERVMECKDFFRSLNMEEYVQKLIDYLQNQF